jgi:hypothetical protein
VSLPLAPDAVDRDGFYTFEAKTNLPEGTHVLGTVTGSNTSAMDEVEVSGGRVPIRIPNSECQWFGGRLQGSPIKIEVIVAVALIWYFPSAGPLPDPGQPRPSPNSQPPAVQDQLGVHFERLVGKQVRDHLGSPSIQVERSYHLAAGTCRSVYDDVTARRSPVRPKPPPPPPRRPTDTYPWCPDVAKTLSVSGGNYNDAWSVARRFNLALIRGEQAGLARLADPSVETFDRHWVPLRGTTKPGGPTPREYPEDLVEICGHDVALRTFAAVLSTPRAKAIFLLVRRNDGWSVWGERP